MCATSSNPSRQVKLPLAAAVLGTVRLYSPLPTLTGWSVRIISSRSSS
jgi:hypothetical protein